MKIKFIIGSLIALSIFSMGCSSNISYRDKDVIVIDYETKETSQENNKLELNLLYKTSVEISYDAQSEESTSYFIKNNIFEFTIKPVYQTYAHDLKSTEIVKARMGKVDGTVDEDGFSNVIWEDLDVTGDLLGERFGSEEFRIRSNDKIYNLNEDGELIKVKAYENIEKNLLNEMMLYKKIYNENKEVVYLQGFINIGVIDEDNDNYLEIKNSEDFEGISENGFEIFGVEEDEIYLYSQKLKGHDKLELLLGYMKNNKFYKVFENENLTIVNQSSINLYNNQAILNNKKILFSGIVEGVNGIWNYDLESKRLSLQMELEQNVISSLYISPNKEKIIIATLTEGEEVVKVSDYIANINQNLEIKDISSVVYNMKSYEGKYFSGFSKDGKKIYYKSSNYEGNEIVYEVYEIKN